jgi:hypothetical protein
VNRFYGTMDWHFLRERLADADRSPESRAAAVWAIDVLEAAFGWPDAWRDGGPPAEIATCYSHVVGLIGTLELALAVTELRGADGFASVRDSLRTSARPDQFASPRIQLKLAAVASSTGIPVRLEPKLAGPPADLLLGDAMVIEVLALLRDAATLAADRWLSELTPILILLGREHAVRFEGEVTEPLDDAQTADLLEQLETAARLAASRPAAKPIQIGQVRVFVSAAPDGAGDSSFRMPAVDHARRLAMRLQTKARQTERSGASWIYCNILSDMWRLPAWSREPLRKKASQLAEVVRAAVGGSAHVRGVVMSDGAAVLRPGATSEEWADIGVRAVKSRLDAFRVRETVALRLRRDHVDELALWEQLIHAEAGWTTAALERAGLAVPPELS